MTGIRSSYVDSVESFLALSDSFSRYFPLIISRLYKLNRKNLYFIIDYFIRLSYINSHQHRSTAPPGQQEDEKMSTAVNAIIEGFTFENVYQKMVIGGAYNYDRARDLPGILRGIDFATVDTDFIVGKLEERLAAIRMNKGRWSYNINVHTAVLQALKAERAQQKFENSNLQAAE